VCVLISQLLIVHVCPFLSLCVCMYFMYPRLFYVLPFGVINHEFVMMMMMMMMMMMIDKGNTYKTQINHTQINPMATEYKNAVLSQGTARCRCKFRCISKFTAASRGFSQQWANSTAFELNNRKNHEKNKGVLNMSIYCL